MIDEGRVRGADTGFRYVMLGGDTCHARQLFCPGCSAGWDIATGKGGSMHRDHPNARHSISLIDKANQLDNCFVLIAHDPALEGIIPEIPNLLNGWRDRGDKHKCEEKGRTLPPPLPTQRPS